MSDQTETPQATEELEEQDHDLFVGFRVKNTSREAAAAELKAWFQEHGIDDVNILDEDNIIEADFREVGGE